MLSPSKKWMCWLGRRRKVRMVVFGLFLAGVALVAHIRASVCEWKHGVAV